MAYIWPGQQPPGGQNVTTVLLQKKAGESSVGLEKYMGDLTCSAGNEPGEQQGRSPGTGTQSAAANAVVAPPQQRQRDHKEAKQAGDGRCVRQVVEGREQRDDRCSTSAEAAPVHKPEALQLALSTDIVTEIHDALTE